MSRLRNAIVALEKSKIPIFKETIMKVLERQRELNIESKHMLRQFEEVTDTARHMIEQEIDPSKVFNMDQMMEDLQN